MRRNLLNQNILRLLVLGLITSACSTQLKVSTEPKEASVHIVKGDSGEKLFIGQTPFQKTDKELTEIGKFGAPGEVVEVLIEKEGYESRSIWLPLTSSGVLESEISLQLKEQSKESAKELKSASQILDQLFLAQSFARAQEFERALIAIDKILEQYPTFSRAVSMKASIHYAKGEFQESLKHYERAIELDPNLKQAVDMAAIVRKRLRLPNRSASSQPGSGR